MSSTSSLLSFSRSLLQTQIRLRPKTRVRLPTPILLLPRALSTLITPTRHALLLDRIRSRQLKEAPKPPKVESLGVGRKEKVVEKGFGELGLGEEVVAAVEEMGIRVPTEIQRVGVKKVLEGESVVLGSHTGSGKTLAYLLPVVQLMRNDEAINGRSMKPRRPRAVVLCPTRELCEQVFRVSKSISHHARFRSTMISGGVRLRPQEDSLNVPIDMVVGTPGRILQHIEEGNMVYGDIKYLVLDEADTMFDRGFGPDIRKFLGPLKSRALKPDGVGFQTVLVTATMTKAVQKLVDEEFHGITHLHTSSFHKKVPTARHDFIKLSGSENKLEALLQALEPSLAKGNRVMVFCNTLNSSRAVDHFLTENQIFTVNYHGEVPAEQRTENIKKFKSDEGDCPTLVCTDLAARGLDLDVDHIIMFDFPSNSIDYLHRTGRTARMGAKGKVTSLVGKKDALLASRIEEAMRKNESLESLNAGNVQRDAANSKQPEQKGKHSRDSKKRTTSLSSKSPVRRTPSRKTPAGKSSTFSKPSKTQPSKAKKVTGSRKNPSVRLTASKLSVVGFRGRSSSRRANSRPS